MTRRTLVAAAVLSFALVACGGGSRGGGESDSGLPKTNWDTWFTNAVPTTVTSSAYSLLPFPARSPQGLGDRLSVYLNQGVAVAFIADSPKYGRVVVVESSPDVPDALVRHQSYVNQVSQNGTDGVHGTASIVKVREGIEGLLTTSEDGSRSALEVVYGGVQFTILGPTLSAAQAIDIANGM